MVLKFNVHFVTRSGFQSLIQRCNVLKKIWLWRIIENPAALRCQINSPVFEELLQSIKRCGLLSPLMVRKVPKKRWWHFQRYIIIDGLHRWKALKVLGFWRAPVSIITITDEALIVARIIASQTRVPTSKAQYRQALLKILSTGMTVKELAAKLGKTEEWVKRHVNPVDEPLLGTEDQYPSP
jgi:ParB/RepB/Spo0J family partition protein